LGHNYGKIVDLTPIKNLTNIAVLDLEGNQIVDISPLRSLKKLRRVGLSKNKIKDISSLLENGEFLSNEL